MPERQFYGTGKLAEMTGYNRGYLQKLARTEYNKPESKRRIDVIFESNRYFIHYDSLLRYMEETGYEGKNSD